MTSSFMVSRSNKVSCRTRTYDEARCKHEYKYYCEAQHQQFSPQQQQHHPPQHSNKHQPTNTSGYKVGRTRRPQRAHCAPLLPAEYLGVSSAAFPRPLQRYIESPLRGRNGLGARALSSVPGGSSHSATTKKPLRRRESHATMAQQPRRKSAVIGRDDVSASSFSADQNDHDDEEEEEEGRVRDEDVVAGCCNDDAVPVLRAAHDGVHHRRGFLTPVGPDWWGGSGSRSAEDVDALTTTMIDKDEAAAPAACGLATTRRDANNRHGRTPAPAAWRSSCKQDEHGQGQELWEGAEFGLLTRSLSPSPSKDGASFQAMQSEECVREDGPRESSTRSRIQSSGTAGKTDSSTTHRTRPRPASAQQPLRASPDTTTTTTRRRNTPQTSQRPSRVSRGWWDLLTGRKINTAKKSCLHPRNKRMSQMSVDLHGSVVVHTGPPREEGDDDDDGESFAEEDDLAWMGDSGARRSDAADRDLDAVRRKPKRRAWEAGAATDPLQYPTPAVRRSVAKFHQKVSYEAIFFCFC